MSTSEGDHPDQAFGLPEGFVLAAIPVIAYLFAFVFEAGFARVFDYPLAFLTPDLTTIFLTGGSLLLIGVFLFLLADLISPVLFRAPDDPIAKKISRLLPMALASIAGLLFAMGTPLMSGVTGYGIAWAMILLTELVLPLLAHRSLLSYREKLQAQMELEAKRRSLLTTISSRLGGPYNLAYYLLLALFVTYQAGQSSAYRQREFLVSTVEPRMIVLKVFGDRAILAPLDHNQHIMDRTYTIMNLSDEAPVGFRLERLAPLPQAPSR